MLLFCTFLKLIIIIIALLNTQYKLLGAAGGQELAVTASKHKFSYKHKLYGQ